jgi:hypothetical protein
VPVVGQVPPYNDQVHALSVLLVEVSHGMSAPIQNAQFERLFPPHLKRFRANL